MTGPTQMEEAVLVVDDDPGMRDTLVSILMENGILAEAAGSGAAAIARAPGLHAAAVLVDQRLPDTLGIDLCGRLKAGDKDLQAILLTGYATLETAIAAVGHVDEFLTKPVPPEQLIRVVRAALARRRLRRENAALLEQLRQANFDLADSVAQRNRDLKSLSAMAEALSSATDLDEVVRIVARAAVETSGASGGAVYLARPGPPGLELGGREGAGDYPHSFPDWPTAEAELYSHGASRLCELSVAGQRVGLLVLTNLSAPRGELLETVATQAALAVQNALRLARERETVERLEELARLKSAFLASVSHELRTPLAAVVGFAEVLQDRWSDLPATDRDHILSRMVAQGDRLRRLIENLLDSTSLEMGTLRVRTERLDMTEVLRSVIDAHPAKLNIQLDTAEHLPAVIADPTRLAQVMANLIDNAVRHGANGSGNVTVGGFATGTGQVEVTVADEGPGIPAAFMPRVFEAFTQAQDPDHHPGGVGLGLHVTRGIVEAMGGTIGVQSQLGVGSTFWIRLPVESGG
ncbi:MAG: sensor histidine kinase [Acidimicrobiales bacterium]